MTDDTNISKLRRMMLKGKNYREEFELEYFGETIVLPLRPLNDVEFLDLLERLDDVIDEEEMQEKLEEIDDEDEMPDEGEFSTEFVEVLQDAAKRGIDPEPLGETEEGIEEIVDNLVGGVSLEIGSEVMEITSNLQDAETFRGE